MKEHQLKTDPDVFKQSYYGKKLFEIRIDDRDFQVGDTVVLLQTKHSSIGMEVIGNPLKYTGCFVERRIIYKVKDKFGLKPGWCCLGLDPSHIKRGIDYEKPPVATLYDLCNDYSLDKSDKLAEDIEKEYDLRLTRVWDCRAIVYIHKEYDEEHYILITSNQDFTGRFYR